MYAIQNKQTQKIVGTETTIDLFATEEQARAELTKFSSVNPEAFEHYSIVKDDGEQCQECGKWVGPSLAARRLCTICAETEAEHQALAEEAERWLSQTEEEQAEAFARNP